MALFTVWKSKLLMPVAINIDANLPNAEVNYKIYSETYSQTLHTCLIMLNYLFKVLLFPTSNTNIMKMCFFPRYSPKVLGECNSIEIYQNAIC